MAPNFTQPTANASANGGTGREAAMNNRAATMEKSSALAKVGGGRRKTTRGTKKRTKRRSSRKGTRRRTSRKGSGKKSHRGGGGTEAPLVKGQSAPVANKLAEAQMAGAENAKYDGKG
jgi:hypothetical protein